MTQSPPANPTPAPISPPEGTPAGLDALWSGAELGGAEAFGGGGGAGGGPPWLTRRITRRQIDLQWLVVTLIMLMAGLVFFGWRAAVEVGVTTALTLASFSLVGLLIRLLRGRRVADGHLYALNSGLMLGVCLPVSGTPSSATFAAVVLGILLHLVGRAHRMRMHAVLAALLLTWMLPAVMMYPRVGMVRGGARTDGGAVLRMPRAFVGDVNDSGNERVTQPWWVHSEGETHDAERRFDPDMKLLSERSRLLEHPSLLVHMLVSGELCRLQELLLGSVPGPIGATSQGLLLLLGLYLMYRRLSWWPAAVMAVIAALATLLAMPVIAPDGHHLTIVALRLGQLAPTVVVTYLAYMLLASPLILCALILGPMTAPTSTWGRMVYGIILGTVLMSALWFLAVPQAGLLGPLVASVLSRPLDHLQGAGPGRA